MTENTLYSEPNIYDIFFSEDLTANDVKFYTELIKDFGQPVLELACGTGRIAIPIAEKGIKITGIDLSEEMIKTGKQKDTQSLVDFRVGDMRNIELNEKYKFIFIPKNSFQHLLTNEDVINCFQSVWEILDNNGAFLIQIFVPYFPILMRNANDRYPTSKEFYIDMLSGVKYFATISNSYNPVTQIQHSTYFYHSEINNVEKTFTLSMRQFFPQEIDALAELNGFKIIGKYGDLEKTPFSEKPIYQNILLKKNN